MAPTPSSPSRKVKALRLTRDGFDFTLTPDRLLKTSPETEKDPVKGTPVLRRGKDLEVFKAIVDLTREGKEITSAAIFQRVWGGDFRASETANTKVPLDYVHVSASKIRRALGLPAILTKNHSGEKNPYRLDLDEPITEVEIDDYSDRKGHDGADPQDSPYQGPCAFTLSDTMFGRDRETAELVELVRNRPARIIFLYSVSGAGKTSIIHAKLRNALETNRFLVLAPARVILAKPLNSGSNPLTVAAIESIEDDPEQPQNRHRYVGPMTWRDYIATKFLNGPGLLIIDQAEELITVLDSPREAKQFFHELASALEQHPAIKVLLAFREESLAEIRRAGSELEKVFGKGVIAEYDLPLLNIDAAKEAISLPALARQVEFEEGVKILLAEGLAARTWRAGEEVEPLQLQLVCDALWKKLRFRQRSISLDDLGEITSDMATGGASRGDPIRAFIDSVLSEFCAGGITAAAVAADPETPFWRDLIDLGLQGFITPAGFRDSIRETEEWVGDLPVAVAEALEERYLLRIREARGERRFEIVHDRLIDPIKARVDRLDDDVLWFGFQKELQILLATNGPDHQAFVVDFCHLLIDGGEPRRQPVATLVEELGESIVLTLADRGILRFEAGLCEVSNRRLAKAIYRGVERDQNRVARARRSVSEAFKNWRDFKRFQNFDYLIEDLQELASCGTLRPDEAELALYGCIYKGTEARDERVYLAETDVELAPLAEALVRKIPWPKFLETMRLGAHDNEEPAIRRNAAQLLPTFIACYRTEGSSATHDSRELLTLVALTDRDQTVRKAAAISLVCVLDESVEQQLFQAVHRAENKKQALECISWLHDRVPENNTFHSRIPPALKSEFRAALRRMRWREKRVTIGFVLGIAVPFTIVPVIVFRTPLAGLGWTIPQSSLQNFVEGLFHGIVGAIIWAVTIGGSILVCGHIVERNPRYMERHFGGAGAFGGFIGGLTISATVAGMFRADVLHSMNWLVAEKASRWQAVGLANFWAMPIYGVFVGLASGLAARQMFSWWNDHRAEWKTKRLQSDAATASTFRVFCRRAFGHCLTTSWLRGTILMTLAGAATWLMLKILGTGTLTPLKLFGESLDLFVGAVGLPVGLVAGLYLRRFGIPAIEE